MGQPKNAGSKKLRTITVNNLGDARKQEVTLGEPVEETPRHIDPDEYNETFGRQ